MTPPAAAAGWFAAALLIGMGLGAVYGFLRPLRRRCQTPADLLFLLAAGWGWLYLGFAVCRGDMRLAYTVGMILGAVAEEMTLGRLLRPVFTGFWQILFIPVKKFSEIGKILFASLEKWGTIRWSNRRHRRHRSGGTPNGKHHQSTQTHPAQLLPQQQCPEDPGHRVHSFRHRGAVRAAGRHGPPAG